MDDTEAMPMISRSQLTYVYISITKQVHLSFNSIFSIVNIPFTNVAIVRHVYFNVDDILYTNCGLLRRSLISINVYDYVLLDLVVIIYT
jgi:hypothetical protein